jgi:hypothetical protein
MASIGGRKLEVTMSHVLTAIALAALAIVPCTTAIGLDASFGTTISAASKKSTPARREEIGQIACTVTGCYRIPPNCHPQTGTTGTDSPLASILSCAVFPVIGTDKDA